MDEDFVVDGYGVEVKEEGLVGEGEGVALAVDLRLGAGKEVVEEVALGDNRMTDFLFSSLAGDTCHGTAPLCHLDIFAHPFRVLNLLKPKMKRFAKTTTVAFP